MSAPNALSSGLFKIGDEITIKRLGYGAMRITGPGIWGVRQSPSTDFRCLRSRHGQ
jgi:pyridoxine 4-dehydrogenase